MAVRDGGRRRSRVDLGSRPLLEFGRWRFLQNSGPLFARRRRPGGRWRGGARERVVEAGWRTGGRAGGRRRRLRTLPPVSARMLRWCSGRRVRVGLLCVRGQRLARQDGTLRRHRLLRGRNLCRCRSRPGILRSGVLLELRLTRFQYRLPAVQILVHSRQPLLEFFDASLVTLLQSVDALVTLCTLCLKFLRDDEEALQLPQEFLASSPLIFLQGPLNFLDQPSRRCCAKLPVF